LTTQDQTKPDWQTIPDQDQTDHIKSDQADRSKLVLGRIGQADTRQD